MIRSIHREYWPLTDDIMKGNISCWDIEARTLYIDFRNKNNDFSLWEFEDMEEAALALISSSTKLESLFLLKLNREQIEEKHIEISKTTGGSAISDQNDYHFDAINMNYEKLGSFLEVILESLKNPNENLYNFTALELKKLLLKSIDNGRIKIEDLKDEVRKKIEKEIANNK